MSMPSQPPIPHDEVVTILKNRMQRMLSAACTYSETLSTEDVALGDIGYWPEEDYDVRLQTL